MTSKSIAAIAEYLSMHFPSHSIEQRWDFDLRAQSFKVSLQAESLLVKASKEFIADFDPAGVSSRLEHWEVAALLRANPHETVLLKRNGPVLQARN